MNSDRRDFDFDVAIVGGGSAGYAAARTAASTGLRTVVVEGGKEVGGLCILRGCMPSKALIYAAEVRQLAQYAALWGLDPGSNAFDWAAVMARKDSLIKEFADERVRQLAGGSFQFLRAKARFTDPHTLALDTGRTLRTRHVLLCTGSVVARSPLPQLVGVGCLTSDEALALKRLPKSLIVLGGGAVGVELAQLFARFDVTVTLIQRSAQVLHDFDTDAVAVLETVLRRDGITLCTDTRLIDAYRDGSQKVITFLHQGHKTEARAEEILFALGRTANTAGLALENAGVATDQRRILTDATMRTSAPHIYAAGDCTGMRDIVHIAVQQGEVAAHNIAHPTEQRQIDYRLLTQVIFTDPQVATVGLTEKQANARTIPYIAARYPFSDHGKSLIMEARDGFVKLLANPTTGEILGGTCVGPMGGELIHEIMAAMAKRMTAQELATMPHYHPTLAEIWTYPAEELASAVGSSHFK